MLNALTFVVFGAAFLQPLIERATWSVALYALLSLTVVRMLPVAIATLRTGAGPATVSIVLNGFSAGPPTERYVTRPG
jgi:NhaP-type Na+/H+ or K+/H+ antiporter